MIPKHVQIAMQICIFTFGVWSLEGRVMGSFHTFSSSPESSHPGSSCVSYGCGLRSNYLETVGKW